MQDCSKARWARLRGQSPLRSVGKAPQQPRPLLNMSMTRDSVGDDLTKGHSTRRTFSRQQSFAPRTTAGGHWQHCTQCTAWAMTAWLLHVHDGDCPIHLHSGNMISVLMRCLVPSLRTQPAPCHDTVQGKRVETTSRTHEVENTGKTRM